MRYVGDGFVIDGAAFTVERNGELVDLEPQAMDLLIHLVEHRGEMRSKVDLISSVWRDAFVSESVLTTRVKQIRRAIGDDGKTQKFIRTVHGRGYMFVADVDVIGSADDAPKPDGDPTHNLPAARVDLVGRSALGQQIDELVGTSRLVTLIGFGGAGKTSLALDCGRRKIGTMADGVWFVDLVPTRSADDVVDAIARAMGLVLGADDNLSTLTKALSEREVLLILDNCEHVLGDAAALANTLLDAAPGLHLLATSRQPLGVAGEHRVAVGPLPVVHDEGGAVDLLQIVAARFGGSIAPEEQVSAVELCRRLDGLPLAIELVGARLNVLSVGEIVERLDKIVVDVGPGPDTRHGSLAAILTETVASVDRDAFVLLATLCRVEGTFTIADVEALGAESVGDAVLSFTELLDRSLITVDPGPPRCFRVLESVRQHLAAVDENPQAGIDAHTRWVQGRLGPDVGRHFHDFALSLWIIERFSDVDATVERLVTAGRAEDAAAVASSTALAMHLDDGSRAVRMLDRIDRLVGEVGDPTLLARLHTAGVMTAMGARSPRGMYEHGIAAVEAADLVDDPSLGALARIMRSWAGVVLDAESALADVDEAIRLANSVGDALTEFMAVGFKLTHLAFSLRFDEAIEVGRAALGDAVDPTSYPTRVVSTGMMACLVLDEPISAIRYGEITRSGARSMGFWGVPVVRGAAQAASGQLDTALETLDVLETRLRRAGIDPLPDILLGPAAAAWHVGDHERAARFMGAVRADLRPTQSLVVSTAYRAMRSHIDCAPPELVGGSTEDVWIGAKRWLAEAARGPTPERSSSAHRGVSDLQADSRSHGDHWDEH